jgi:protein SCO1/2
VGWAQAVSQPNRESVPDASIMRIDEPRYLGAPLDRTTMLEDSEGRRFAVGELLGKPVILLLSYYGCDGSCPTMNLELAKALARVERFQLGRDYRVLTLSFDARDTSATAAEFLRKTGSTPPEGWRHAVLRDREVGRFAGSIGFNFFWSDAARAFLHPNVLVFLTPEGRVARYIYGTRMDARTIELALTDADWERIANSAAVFDMLTGACFSYNYAEGRYQWNVPLLAGVGSLLLGLGLLGTGIWMYRRRLGRGHA